MACLQLLDEDFHIDGDYFFRRLPLRLLLIMSFHLHCFGLLAARSAFLSLTMSEAGQKRLNGQTAQNDDRDPA
jgi:hypothetical protein